MTFTAVCVLLVVSDLDECLSGQPCEQVCTNTEGSFECSCNHGYLVDPDDPNGCVGESYITIAEHVITSSLQILMSVVCYWLAVTSTVPILMGHLTVAVGLGLSAVALHAHVRCRAELQQFVFLSISLFLSLSLSPPSTSLSLCS